MEDIDRIVAAFPTDAPSWANSIVQLCRNLATQLASLNTSISQITLLDSKVAIQSKVINILHEENKKLNGRLDETIKIIDTNEQHDRNVNLLLHGVAENKGEAVTNVFVDELNKHLPIILKYDDIARSHRLGPLKVNASKPRPIIARFRDETKKIKIYKVKKGLKGKGITLTENLTKRRQSLYIQASTHLGYKKCWTNEGRIFTKVDDRFIEIISENDIPGLTTVSSENIIENLLISLGTDLDSTI